MVGHGRGRLFISAPRGTLTDVMLEEETNRGGVLPTPLISPGKSQVFRRIINIKMWKSTPKHIIPAPDLRLNSVRKVFHFPAQQFLVMPEESGSG